MAAAAQKDEQLKAMAAAEAKAAAVTAAQALGTEVDKDCLAKMNGHVRRGNFTDREGLLMFYFDGYKPRVKGAAGSLASEVRALKTRAERKVGTDKPLWDDVHCVVKDFATSALKMVFKK